MNVAVTVWSAVSVTEYVLFVSQSSHMTKMPLMSVVAVNFTRLPSM